MSFLRKSDVKNHLSTRSGTSTHPPDRPQPPARDADSAANLAGNVPATGAGEGDLSISPSHPVSPEPTANAQIGGSIGIPEGQQNAGSQSK